MLGAEDVFERNFEAASQRPEFVETLDFKNGAVARNRHVNHPSMIDGFIPIKPTRTFRVLWSAMDRTTVFTDGAAKGNPGPGGWGAILVTPDDFVTELGGGSPHTTNNKMELSGAIAALEQIANIPGAASIYSDSTYLIQGITQWVWGWRKKGWRTATGGDVLNR